MNIQFRDGGIDIFSNCALPVDGKRRIPGPFDKLAPDDYVRLPGLALQLELDVSILLGLFHERIQILTTKNLGDEGSTKSSGTFERTHTWRKVEPEAYSASNAALSRSVWTNYHVLVRTGTEFDKVIGNKILELNPHNGSRHVSLTRLDTARTEHIYAHPSASRAKVPGCEDPSVSPFT